jgi:hypothetical protein
MLNKTNHTGPAEDQPACSPALLCPLFVRRPTSLSFDMAPIMIKPGEAVTALLYPHYQQYLL